MLNLEGVNFLSNLISGNYFKELRNRKLALNQEKQLMEYMGGTVNGAPRSALGVAKQEAELGAYQKGLGATEGMPLDFYSTTRGAMPLQKAQTDATIAGIGQTDRGLDIQEMEAYDRGLQGTQNYDLGLRDIQSRERLGAQQAAAQKYGARLGAYTDIAGQSFSPTYQDALMRGLHPYLFGGEMPQPPENEYTAMLKEREKRLQEQKAVTDKRNTQNAPARNAGFRLGVTSVLPSFMNTYPPVRPEAQRPIRPASDQAGPIRDFTSPRENPELQALIQFLTQFR